MLTFSAWIEHEPSIPATALVFDTPNLVEEKLLLWKGERVLVRVEKASSRRTLPQNRLIWRNYQKAIEHFSELSPFSKDDLHEYFKREYCPAVELVLPGGEVTEIKSTKRLTVEQMSTYIEKVFAHLAQWGYTGEQSP